MFLSVMPEASGSRSVGAGLTENVTQKTTNVTKPALLREQGIISQSPIPNPQFIIRIADNGCGISEDVCRHIFDPFFTTKPVGSGTKAGGQCPPYEISRVSAIKREIRFIKHYSKLP
jgi:signal transduction histidine kinase